jgi:hypothetical protein
MLNSKHYIFSCKRFGELLKVKTSTLTVQINSLINVEEEEKGMWEGTSKNRESTVQQ